MGTETKGVTPEIKTDDYREGLLTKGLGAYKVQLTVDDWVDGN
jgi:hypothetical protein